MQYHFLERPYSLVPLTATAVPQAQLYDAQGRHLPPTAPAREVARAVYTIAITPGIRYQDHPSFARTADGRYRWFLQPGEHFPPISHPNELPQHGSRELTGRRLRLPDQTAGLAPAGLPDFFSAEQLHRGV